MKCPICESSAVRVTNVRNQDSKIYRIRKCLSCGEKFTSWEVNSAMLMEIFEDQFSLEISNKIAKIIEKEFPIRNRIKNDYGVVN